MAVTINQAMREIQNQYPDFEYCFYFGNRPTVLIVPYYVDTETKKRGIFFWKVQNYYDCVLDVDLNPDADVNAGGFLKFRLRKNRLASAPAVAEALCNIFGNKMLFLTLHDTILLDKNNLDNFKKECFILKMKS